MEHVLAAWQSSQVDQVTVVVRKDDLPLQTICRNSGVSVCVATHDPRDMKESVELGLRSIAAQFAPAENDAWLLAPADLPQLEAAVIDRVVDAYDPDQPVGVVPVCEGRGGHPVLFPWFLRHAIGKLGPADGINMLLKHHPPRRIPVDCPGSQGDVDTPEDYQRLLDFEQRE